MSCKDESNLILTEKPKALGIWSHNPIYYFALKINQNLLIQPTIE